MLYTIIAIALGVFFGYLLTIAVAFVMCTQPKVIKWYMKKMQHVVDDAIEEACADLDL